MNYITKEQAVAVMKQAGVFTTMVATLVSKTDLWNICNAAIQHYIDSQQPDYEHSEAYLRAAPEQRGDKGKGTNCKAVSGVGHSPECIDEHDAAANCGTLDTPGNRNPEYRYAGYKGTPLPLAATTDQTLAYEEGQRAARVSQQQGDV